jgi:hypothetical protein
MIAHMAKLRLLHRATIAFLLWLPLCQSEAADRKEWVTLTNCQYVAADYNDGDSFRVRNATNEFVLRLYFVDAPETNLRYPERTREQSEYFGVTLDETMKAGAKARYGAGDLTQAFCRTDALGERGGPRQGAPLLWVG